MKKLILFSSLVFIPLFFALIFYNPGPNSWSQLLSSAVVFNDCIAINPTSPDIIYAGTNGAGVYQTTNGGLNWTQVNSGLTDLAVQCLTISNSSPTTLYAGGITGGMFKTTNSGTSWTQINTGITELGRNVQAIAVKTNDPNTAVICLFDGVNIATNGVYKTTDGGATWAASTSGIFSHKNFLSLTTTSAAPNTLYIGSSFAAGVSGNHIYKSYNFGSSWIDVSNGFDTSAATGTDAVRDLSMSTIDTNRVLAGRFFNTTNGGPWLTTNGGTNWAQIAGGIPVAVGLLIRSCKIKPGSNTEYFLGINGSTTSPFGGVWRTTNGGTNWFSFNSTVMDSSKTVRSVNFRTTPDVTLYAGVSAPAGTTAGVYAYTFVPPAVLPTYCKCDSSAYVPITGGSPGPSGDDNTITVPIGWTFTHVGVAYTNASICTNGFVVMGSSTFNSFTVNLCGLVAGQHPMLAPFWTDLNTATAGTITYTTLGTAGTRIFVVQYDNVGFFAGGPGRVTMQVRLYENGNRVEFHYGPGVANATEPGAVGLSKSPGGSGNVFSITPNATSPCVPGISTTVCNNAVNYIYPNFNAGRKYIWNCPVGIEPVTNGIPHVYSLSQNYPNPFNPATKISYALPTAGNVKLVVYDLLGREVAVLVNDFKKAGNYDVNFNASNLSSGIYLYKIESGEFNDTKKMMLIK